MDGPELLVRCKAALTVLLLGRGLKLTLRLAAH